MLFCELVSESAQSVILQIQLQTRWCLENVWEREKKKKKKEKAEQRNIQAKTELCHHSPHILLRKEDNRKGDITFH